MKILFLPNWKVRKCEKIPDDIQAPDYYTNSKEYWFFKYFSNDATVDVLDIETNNFIENIERNKFHFYIVQAIKAFLKMKKYDIVVSHGMPSAIFLSLLRRLFGKRGIKHVVFDIGCFNSAAESGKIMKINQFVSKSIDGIICHESMQLEYYKRFYPWLVEKSIFIPFGTDLEYFEKDKIQDIETQDYIVSIGYSKRDNETMIKAFSKISTDSKLVIVGPGDKEVAPNIIMKKAMPKRELNEVIQKAKFCILPLEYANYSFGQMTLLQQMYYGKLVITAKVPSVMDYVEDNENAILYNNKDVEDLKSKIEICLQNKDIIARIGNNARKSVINKFHEKNMALQVEKFLEKILNKQENRGE